MTVPLHKMLILHGDLSPAGTGNVETITVYFDGLVLVEVSAR